MAFDGIVTYAVSKELSEKLTLGKIEKVYQPDSETLLLNIHTKQGNVKLIASSSSQAARICLTEEKYINPMNPPRFCMLIRKHIQGGRIVSVKQYESERIIEMDIEALNEMGFTVSRCLIFEIMGKHSNIILINLETGKVIDSIKRISIDVNRYRQLLPGVIYKYPPLQEKIPFKELTASANIGSNAKAILSAVGGISPSVAEEMSSSELPIEKLQGIVSSVENMSYIPRIYSDKKGIPKEFHITPLIQYKGSGIMEFTDLSKCIEYFYSHRASSNMIKQKSADLLKTVKSAISKAQLKKKRLGEDLLKAENSEKYRIYGELLTANIHMFSPGYNKVEVINYYTGEPVTIPLSEKLSPAKNAQRYFKKYSKAKTAVKEKTIQLEETKSDLEYLNSVLVNIENMEDFSSIDQIRDELVETGYLKFRSSKAQRNKKKANPKPLVYYLSTGEKVLVGRNNKENDYLTMKISKKTDLWFHTKDIPGSHVVLPLGGDTTISDILPETIYETAQIAAYHSKAKESSNVPVDCVPVRYVKKPNGAKPGMVIFTHNNTVYVDPKIPKTNK